MRSNLLSRRTIVPALLLLSTAAQAAAPRTIPVQGRLVRPSGTGVTGTQSITFRLYRSPTDATVLWTETDALFVQDGRFNAILGDGTPFPPALTFAEPYYVGISVAGDTEMAPRLPLAAVPYALALPNVMVAPSGNVGIRTSVPTSELTVAGTVESTSIGFRFPDGTVQGTAVDAARVARAPFVQGFVSGLLPKASFALSVLIDGTPTEPGAALAAPYTVRLDRISYRTVDQTGRTIVTYLPGRLQVGSLVLRRPISRDRTWAEWHRSTFAGNMLRHDVEIHLVQDGVVKSSWVGHRAWVSRYRLRLSDDGLPVEEIALVFDDGDQLQRVPSDPFKGSTNPTSGAQVGFTSGQSGTGKSYRALLDGSVVTGGVIVADAGATTNTVEYRSGTTGETFRIPGETDPGVVTVRQNPAAGTMLHEWFGRVAQGDTQDRRDLSLELAPDFLNLLQMKNVWPSSITLRVADDGLPVEDFELAGNLP